MIYDINLLRAFVELNNLELVGIYRKLTSTSDIVCKCKTAGCDDVFVRTLYILVNQANFFCKSCNKILGLQKRKRTNLKRYGIELMTQRQDIIPFDDEDIIGGLLIQIEKQVEQTVLAEKIRSFTTSFTSDDPIKNRIIYKQHMRSRGYY